ncbi:MAG: hypothetical protein HDR03_16390 [Lachnospiraceae bacterium]|nr:hypothetical protein [Lachnospiraceae bacterium]
MDRRNVVKTIFIMIVVVVVCVGCSNTGTDTNPGQSTQQEKIQNMQEEKAQNVQEEITQSTQQEKRRMYIFLWMITIRIAV